MIVHHIKYNNMKIQKLAKREEELMRVIWKLQKAFIKDIIDELPEPRPHYNTVATIVKILEEKGFLDHVTYGNTYQYYPVIKREEYRQQALGDMLDKYFDSSYMSLVTYFAKNEKISVEELESIIHLINQSDQ